MMIIWNSLHKIAFNAYTRDIRQSNGTLKFVPLAIKLKFAYAHKIFVNFNEVKPVNIDDIDDEFRLEWIFMW